MHDVNQEAVLTDSQEGTLDRREILKGLLTMFLPMFALAIAIAGEILFVGDRVEMEAYRDTQRHNVEIQSRTLESDFQHVFSELVVVANTPELVKLWRDDGNIHPRALAHLTEEFLNLVKYTKIYDQGRLLDKRGMEIARVNFNNGHPVIVPQEELQNKKGRYYFEDTFKLNRGDVFVSPLDLNVEGGKIERPPKPMIRFGTPIFDRNGEKRGIVLLNYFGEKMLDRFSSEVNASKDSQAMLLNADGYWLKAPNPEDEWGFMYSARKYRTFAKIYPEEWKRIQSEESCQFESPRGLFTSRTVYPLLKGQTSSTEQLEGSKYYWKIVSFTPSGSLYAARDNRRIVAVVVLVLLGVTLLFVSWQVATASAIRRHAMEALREREQVLAAISESAQDAIVLIDSDDKVTHWNRAAERIFGYAQEEVVGRVLHDFLLAKNMRAVHCEAFPKFVASGRGAAVGQTLEVPGLHKDGREIPVELSLSATYIHGQWHAIGIMRDITERKQAEDELQRTFAETERMNRLMSGREDRVLELKEEVNALLAELGRKPQYSSVAMPVGSPEEDETKRT